MKERVELTVRRQLRDLFKMHDKHIRRAKQIDDQITALIPAYMKEERLLMRPFRERIRNDVLFGSRK